MTQSNHVSQKNSKREKQERNRDEEGLVREKRGREEVTKESHEDDDHMVVVASLA